MSATDNMNVYRTALEGEKARLTGELSDLGFGEEGLLAYDNNFADTSQVTAERGEAEALAGELADTLGEVGDVDADFDFEHGSSPRRRNSAPRRRLN